VSRAPQQRFGPHLFDAAKLEAVSGVSASPAAGNGEGFESEEVRASRSLRSGCGAH
jgi:hypothetical protein